MAQIRACTVCSGSSANAVYIEIGENAILIDAGCTEKNLTAFLREINSSYDKIKAVFVTHEHCDHIKAVPGLTKRKIPIIANKATLQTVFGLKPDCDESFFRELPTGFTARNGDFEITSFRTSHDCAESVGYIIKTEGGNIGVVTDLGQYDVNTVAAVSSCRLVFIEANHDEDMLWNGKYPYPLKRRIGGVFGHLSNDQCGKLLAESGENVEFAVLSHLSRENNTPEKAVFTVSKFAPEKIKISVAPRNERSEFIYLQR